MATTTAPPATTPTGSPPRRTLERRVSASPRDDAKPCVPCGRRLTVAVVPPPGKLPTGLVALWSGEGNANDSVGGNNGTLTGSATFGPGKVGQGFVFDGNNGSGVKLGNPASL